MIARRLGMFALVAALVGFVHAAPAAAGSLRALIVQPHLDRIEDCRTGLDGLQVQFDDHMAELQEQRAFHERRKQTIAEKTEGLRKAWADRIERARLTAASAAATAKNAEGQLANFGWQTVEQLKEGAAALKDEYDKVMQEVEDGKYSFHVQFIGWINRRALEERIADLDKRIAEQQALMARGDWRAHLPNLGWTTRTGLEDCIAAERAEIDRINAEIEAGTYSVNIPTIGWTDRNGLEARIRDAEAAIADLDRQVAEGVFSVNRPLFGWSEMRGLEAAIADKTKALADFKAHVSDPWYKAHVPATGWLSTEAIQDRVMAAERGIENVEKWVADGVYRVVMANGAGIDRNQIEQAIETAEGDYKDMLVQALKDISTKSKLDIEIWLLEKSIFTSWAAEILKYARPQVEGMEIDLNAWSRHQGDFAEEARTRREHLERNLARLRAAEAFLP